MTSEAVASAALEQDLETELDSKLDPRDEQNIPTLSSIVQSGDVEAIQFAREHFVSEDNSPAEVVDDSPQSPLSTPDMVFESDLERTIDAIISQHINIMRTEIKAVLALHNMEFEKD